MFVDWFDSAEKKFGEDILLAKHDIAETNLFDDDGLAYLLDTYPRENLDIWTFGTGGEGLNRSLRGRANALSGKDIVDAVHNGHIWLNMRRANEEVPELKPVADAVFGSLENATGQRTRKRDVSVLISSPKVDVHYHLDIPLVALFQMRGQKRLWMYPVGEDYAPSEFIEDIVHMHREEDLPYRRSFDEDARIFALKPGMGLTWPQLMPHRVQNADCVNVSLSCEYMTLGSLIQANAIYTNKLLRKATPLSSKAGGAIGPLTVAKAAFARAHKAIDRREPRKSPTPITFELDTSAENCVRPLFA